MIRPKSILGAPMLTLTELTALPKGAPVVVDITLFGDPAGSFSTRIAETTQQVMTLEPIEDHPHLQHGAKIGAAPCGTKGLFYGRDRSDDAHLGWFFHCRLRRQYCSL